MCYLFLGCNVNGKGGDNLFFSFRCQSHQRSLMSSYHNFALKSQSQKVYSLKWKHKESNNIGFDFLQKKEGTVLLVKM